MRSCARALITFETTSSCSESGLRVSNFVEAFACPGSDVASSTAPSASTSAALRKLNLNLQLRLPLAITIITQLKLQLHAHLTMTITIMVLKGRTSLIPSSKALEAFKGTGCGKGR